MHKRISSLFAFALVFAGLLAWTPYLAHAQVETEADVSVEAEVTADQGKAEQGILATLRTRGNFTTLVSALEKTGMAADLKKAGEVTLFAPTDAAFQALPPNTLKEISAEKLAGILRYHVVAGAQAGADLAGKANVKTLQGTKLAVTSQGQQLQVGNATVTEAGIQTSGGVIHVIDTVLMPKPAGTADASTSAPTPDSNM